MKTIRPFNNTPTIVHVTKLPELTNCNFDFGFNPGKLGDTPTIRVNVKFIAGGNTNNPIKIATYDSAYEIKGEGLVLEDHIYACCQQAVHAMKLFLQYNEIGRSIPQDIIQCPGKDAFVNDLTELAKMLNAIDGKRGFPNPEL